MKAPEQQTMFKEMGAKTFYIGQGKDNPKRANIMLEGQKMFYTTSSLTLRQNQLLRHQVIFMNQQQ